MNKNMRKSVFSIFMVGTILAVSLFGFCVNAVSLENTEGTVYLPNASNVSVKENEKCVIDYSNISDGYVMVRYKNETDKRLKVQVKSAIATYTYNITPGKWETLPLSEGNGEYKVTVFENVVDSKYSSVVSQTFTVELKDEFSPFLYSNQYVNYAEAPKTIDKAAELTANSTNDLDKVVAIYNYVVNNFTYDYDLAQTVKTGYLPVIDTVLEKKSGICFDYAALMTGMLRSQGIPCKLVVGYVGDAYHAWINVWTEETGWINEFIKFDGSVWHRMDPTFASSGNSSEKTMKYIGDGTNYVSKYTY